LRSGYAFFFVFSNVAWASSERTVYDFEKRECFFKKKTP
jgi:hypothetical protein